MLGKVLGRMFSVLVAISLSATAMAENSVRSVLSGTMAEMTYVEVEEAARGGAVALWALGSIEEHGPHLPLEGEANAFAEGIIAARRH